MIAAFLTHLWG